MVNYYTAGGRAYPLYERALEPDDCWSTEPDFEPEANNFDDFDDFLAYSEFAGKGERVDYEGGKKH